ncbi:MAG: hypothetical protein JNM88_08180, partial [Chitinophagaceae bacterium]|nr:hypothetical protein [Chitinophagaceae bacterium]
MDIFTPESGKENSLPKIFWGVLGVIVVGFATVFIFQREALSDHKATIKEKNETISLQGKLHESEMRAANEKYLEVNTNLLNTKLELDKVKEKKQEYYEMYRKYETEAVQLKDELRRTAATGGNTETTIRLIEVEGELDRYKAALDNANTTIAQMVTTIREQSEELVAKQARITELEESLAASLQKETAYANELLQLKQTTRVQLEQAALMLEQNGDNLKDKRKFSEAKLGFYKVARMLLQ